MEKPEVKSYVETHLTAYAKEFGIDHWVIKVKFGLCENVSSAGECRADGLYEDAMITINPDEIETLEELDHVLRHELLHVVQYPFNEFWRNVHDAIDGDQRLVDVLRGCQAQYQERLVKRLENLVECVIEAHSTPKESCT
jgi:hypothetical protein